jgi:protease II
VLGGFDPTNYQSERVLATAPDGVQVPVAVVYRKDKFNKDGTNPLYLYGYGAFWRSARSVVFFDRISLLDGIVFAHAQTRGAARWDANDLVANCPEEKFHGFIACAGHLITPKNAPKTRSSPMALPPADC